MSKKKEAKKKIIQKKNMTPRIVPAPKALDIIPEPKLINIPIAIPVPVLETKTHCLCCTTLVPESELCICAQCSFEGCVKCRPTGTCPTCNRTF